MEYVDGFHHITKEDSSPGITLRKRRPRPLLPLVLALVPLRKFPIDFQIFPMEVPVAKWKWPCPLKDESPGLRQCLDVSLTDLWIWGTTLPLLVTFSSELSNHLKPSTAVHRTTCVPCVRQSPHGFTLQAGTLYPSFKTTADDIERSDSRRVDCVLSGCIHRMISHCRLAWFTLGFHMHCLNVCRKKNIAQVMHETCMDHANCV